MRYSVGPLPYVMAAFAAGVLVALLFLQAPQGGTGAATVTVTVPGEVTRTVTVVEKGGVEQTCFSRVEECDRLLISLISQARGSIYVAVYSFTRDGLARALVEAKNRGVEVRVVMERDNAFGQGSEYEFLKANGVDVRLDGNPASMHHKFMVVDGEVVVTGSYNWSTAAEDRNDENIVVIRDAGIASRFIEEFNRVWGR